MFFMNKNLRCHVLFGLMSLRLLIVQVDISDYNELFLSNKKSSFAQ